MSGEQAYQNAMKRRAELRQELDEIETFLRLYEKFAGREQPAAHNTALESPRERDQLSTAHLETVAGMKLIPHIRRAILDGGRPLPRGDIVKALSDRGIKVSGQDPAQSVATLMWRAKREFINLTRLGYWPRDVAYAPAGHDPAQDDDPQNDEDHKENGSAATAQAEKRERDEDDLWSADRPAA
jgi:hypothetical protein